MNCRILHIRADTDALNPIEGATRMIQNYIHYADCAGFESYLLLICSGPDAQRAFTGIPPERLLLITDFSNRSLLKFSFWKKIISFIQENCIGILHSHSYKADLIAVMLNPSPGRASSLPFTAITPPPNDLNHAFCGRFTVTSGTSLIMLS